MKPFWVLFIKPPFGWTLDVGVTAIDEREAQWLTQVAVGPEAQIASIRWVRDAAELDEGHVVPNMGNLLRRGVWFPRGFEHLT